MKRFLKNSKGQIIVEYILLLGLSVILALGILKITSITTDSDFLNLWIKTIDVIGQDIST